MDAVAAEPDDSIIWLSGGVDSATALAASLALGRRPDLMTFTIRNKTPHQDLRVAMSMAKTFGLQLYIAEIPRESLEADCRHLCRLCAQYTSRYTDMKPVYKVFIQVAHGCLYMLRMMEGLTYSTALTGFCADAYWGSGRRMETLRRQDQKAWQEYRERYVTSEFNSESFVYWLATLMGLSVHDPWAADGVRAFMLATDYKVMHSRTSKSLAIDAFPEFWSRGAWVRPNSSLQVNSGLREFHDTLLQRANPHGHKAIIAIYNDMVRQ